MPQVNVRLLEVLRDRANEVSQQQRVFPNRFRVAASGWNGPGKQTTIIAPVKSLPHRDGLQLSPENSIQGCDAVEVR